MEREMKYTLECYVWKQTFTFDMSSSAVQMELSLVSASREMHLNKTFNQSDKRCVLQREKQDGRNGVIDNICSWGLSALKIGLFQPCAKLLHVWNTAVCCFTMQLKYSTIKQFRKYMHKEKYYKQLDVFLLKLHMLYTVKMFFCDKHLWEL